jgi:hypothetical protein
MGFVASYARVLTNKSRMLDLQFQQQMINQALMQMSSTVGSLFSMSSNLEPNSPTAQALNAQLAVVQTVEKGLTLQLQRISVELKMIEAESEGLNKIVDNNIKSSFKLLG